MSIKIESVNPMNTLRDFLTSTIEGLEAKGKTPTNLLKALELFNVVKDANNTRIKGLRELRDFVKAAVKESEDKGKPSKNLQVLSELVKDVASINHGRIAELLALIETANGANDALLKRAEAMEAALNSEPAKHTLTIIRNAAILNEEQSAEHEAVSVTADPESVLTRIVPIVSTDSGVVGFAVLFNHSVKHTFYFDRFASELEVARGSALDLDNNKSDGLLVYQVTLNAAVTLADKYAQLLGPLGHVVSTGSASMSDTFESTSDELAGEGLESSDDDDESSDEDPVVVVPSNSGREEDDSADDIEGDDD